ncbi:CYTH domain-containing protein [Chryseomicrobium palamuruense]|uniref:CYTH domain-containing protein n=1 Tax=Chryseomicrobium palamuruense TaxID=682973 RepID=A0ABV8UT24_9BACL
MNKHNEIEFKTMLTEAEYEHLIHAYPSPSYTQKNIYLDTRDGFYQKRKIGCRIRIKNDSYEFTLKEPKTDDITEETNWPLHKTDFLEFQRTGNFKPDWLDVPTPLVSIGEIVTTRSEHPFRSGQLMMDRSTYFDVIDYELEFEVANYKKGKAQFEELLVLHNLPFRPAKKKLVRMLEVSK